MSKVLTYFVLCSIFISLVIFLFSPEILKILVPVSYLGAVKVISLLLLGVIFFGIAGVIITGISLRKKTEFVAFSVIIAAFVNIILNILLIPKWGMIGAATATAISYFTLSCFYYIFAQKFYPIDYEIKKIIKIFVLGVFFFIIGSFIKTEVILYAIIMKTIMVFSFLLMIFYSSILNKTEKAVLKIAFQKIKSRFFYVIKQ